MVIEEITGRIARDLEHLKQFTATPGKRLHQAAFTKEARQAVEYLKELMTESGLDVREDAAGNVIGVNTSGLVTQIGTEEQSVNINTSVNYASVADQLIRILDEERIEYTLMGEKNWMFYTFAPIGGIALILGIILLISDRKKTPVMSAAKATGGASVGKPAKKQPVRQKTAATRRHWEICRTELRSLQRKGYAWTRSKPL